MKSSQASGRYSKLTTIQKPTNDGKEVEGDNPTIGIVLCSETSRDIARYSIPKGNEQLFAAKYKTFLPTEEQLRTEIERQKQIFMLQHEKNKEKE